MLSIFSCASWPSEYLLWRNVYSIGLLAFLLLSYISCLYILEIKPLSVASFETIFSHSVGCVFSLFFFFLVVVVFFFLFFFNGFLCCAKACQLD